MGRYGISYFTYEVTPSYQRLYLKDTVTNTAGLIIRNEEFGNSQVKRNYDCFLEHMTPFL